MLEANFWVTTPNLLIRRSLAELTQAAFYAHMPKIEHDGYRAKSGKIFKGCVFNARYDRDRVVLRFAAFRKENEAEIAKAMLMDDFRLGAVQVARKEVALFVRNTDQETINIKGCACAYVADTQGRRLFLQPRDSRFIEVVTNNLKEKYETFYQTPYDGPLEITTRWQADRPVLFHYGRSMLESYPARYAVSASKPMLDLILNTGLGAKTMQGVGWMDIVKERENG